MTEGQCDVTWRLSSKGAKRCCCLQLRSCIVATLRSSLHHPHMSCPLCDDTGWKAVDEGSIRRVVRCDCWRENVGRQRLSDANIPKRYLHCTLGNFTAYNESLKKAVAQARRVADAFPVVDRGLLLEGQPGVGKTHIAVAVLKQAIQTTGARGLFYDVRDLLRVIRSTYDPAI